MFYHLEDERLFVSMGICNAREILFWGINLNEDGTPLGKTLYQPICELSDSHIGNILKHNEENGMYLSNLYCNFLNNELKVRKLEGESREKMIKKQNQVLKDC